MISETLVSQAGEFAKNLSKLISSTISDDIKFVVIQIQPSETLLVVPEGSDGTSIELIPITTILTEGQPIKLWLKVSFEVDLDHENKYLRVINSLYALVVDSNSSRPAIRIEYNRDRGSEPGVLETRKHVRSAAHVQIHGTSDEFALIQGLNGETKIRSLEDYHIPVGGKEFRPSLEDFIEFIHKEGLVPKLKDGWLKLIRESQKDWLQRQVKSAVRSNPEAAIEQLIDLGYQFKNYSKS